MIGFASNFQTAASMEEDVRFQILVYEEGEQRVNKIKGNMM